MRVYQFTVPLEKNRAKFEEHLAFEFGGFTVIHGDGAWFNAGETVYERVAIYTVAVVELTGGFQLRGVVRDFLKGIGEQAMYFAEVGTAQVEFL